MMYILQMDVTVWQEAYYSRIQQKSSIMTCLVTVILFVKYFLLHISISKIENGFEDKIVIGHLICGIVEISIYFTC